MNIRGRKASITKLADVQPLLLEGRQAPQVVLPRLRHLAASDQWQTREVAASALVELAKRHAAVVLKAADSWSRDKDENVRRAASEGLRGLVQRDPEGVQPILERLRADPHLYVRKSVANVLRNASRTQPEFVLRLCMAWARSPKPGSTWVVREGLRKLVQLRPAEAAKVLALLAGPTQHR